MDTAIQMFKFENEQEIRVVQGDDGILLRGSDGRKQA